MKYIRDAIKKIKIQRTNLGFSQIPNSNPKDVKMALFHSNETVCFDQNNLFWYKTTSFWPTPKTRGVPNDLSSSNCSSSSTFCTQKDARVTTFQSHLMFISPPNKTNKTSLSWPDTVLHPQCDSCWLVAYIAAMTPPQRGWSD